MKKFFNDLERMITIWVIYANPMLAMSMMPEQVRSLIEDKEN